MLYMNRNRVPFNPSENNLNYSNHSVSKLYTHTNILNNFNLNGQPSTPVQDIFNTRASLGGNDVISGFGVIGGNEAMLFWNGIPPSQNWINNNTPYNIPLSQPQRQTIKDTAPVYVSLAEGEVMAFI